MPPTEERMSNVVQFPAREYDYDGITEAVGVSRRFIEARVQEGMPSRLHYSGKRIFRLDEVIRFLDERQAKRDRA